MRPPDVECFQPPAALSDGVRPGAATNLMGFSTGRAHDAVQLSKRADARRRGGASSPEADRHRPALQLIAEPASERLLNELVSTGEERQGQKKARRQVADVLENHRYELRDVRAGPRHRSRARTWRHHRCASQTASDLSGHSLVDLDLDDLPDRTSTLTETAFLACQHLGNDLRHRTGPLSSVRRSRARCIITP